MARGTQHRKRRPRPHAGAVAQPAPQPKRRAKAKHPTWEEQLFFSRLRVHAKWMFVLLAIAFGLGFVIFGVGSGSTGISDALQNFFSRSGGSGSSLSSLQKKAHDHPKSVTAWRNLATKLEQDQKVDRAIGALVHYTRIAPKDQSALEELAGLYVRRASDYYNIYAGLLTQSQLVSPNSVFRPATTSAFGKAFANQDPILANQSTIVSTKQTAALTKLSLYNSQSEGAYKKLAALSPDNATYQFQLAEVANNLGDKPVAIKAYKAFLKLAPNDALAPRAQQALKTLKGSVTVTSPGTKKSGGR
jgi:tetratricopeptide (TPR) repeat protein